MLLQRASRVSCASNSFLRSLRCYSQIITPDAKGPLGPRKTENKPNKLLQQIIGRIRFDGPMTVAQYMQEILAHPSEGYYMKKDAFGREGDFITAPEISQMFGECLAIWILHEWKKMGGPLPLQLVELGPGRGSLMQDILRTFMKLDPTSLQKASVHLVETSPLLKQLQEAVLCGSFHSSKNPIHEPIISKYGPQVHWHTDLATVSAEVFTVFIANEFFDALPIHKFVKMTPEDSVDSNEVAGGCHVWREVLVDIEEVGGETKLRFVRARHRTPACRYLTTEAGNPYLEHQVVEISPKSGLIIEELSRRIVRSGGIAILADYGHNGSTEHGDTLRAFKKHKLHDPLDDPGLADITSDVDFAYIQRHAGENTLTYGPVTQRDFLLQLGIELRLKKLLQSNASKTEICSDLQSSYDMLIDPAKMGERFKFFSIFPKTMLPIHEKVPPAGFVSVKQS